MEGWRLTKYDPALRDAAGRYPRAEWTSMGDIGRVIGGQVLDAASYVRTEAAYIETIMAFYVEAGSPDLFVRDLEYHGVENRLLSEADRGDVLSFAPAEGLRVGPGALHVVVRSCLREIMWCRLGAEDESCQIHFGHDYYVYLTGRASSARTLDVAREKGLFLERFSSPY